MPRSPHHSSNWGGARPNAGRQNPHKFSQELARQAAEDGLHPFEYLISVMRDEQEDKKIRMYCANACLPYCLQKLVATEVKVTNDLEGLTLAEKVALASSLSSEIKDVRPEMTLPAIPQLEAIEGEVVEA